MKMSAMVIAKATVTADATPSDEMVETGMSSMPRKHKVRVTPETRTVWPDVSSIVTIAARYGRLRTCGEGGEASW